MLQADLPAHDRVFKTLKHCSIITGCHDICCSMCAPALPAIAHFIGYINLKYASKVKV